ncbi:MAG: FKBP-type peptidyl-prolyl cis-trans isomerase [Thiobacillaceae bacterium]
MTARIAAYGDSLSLRYALRLRDGTEILSNFDDPTPDTLTLGDSTLAQNLEQWLIGVAVGERHVFMLDAWQAFGVSQPELIHHLPKSDLSAGVRIETGTLVEFTMPNGQTMAGQILEILDDSVKVDFNHPLADLPIEFEVEIIELYPRIAPA